jgi:hypothetical protein
MEDSAVEQVGHGGEPDMRMRPHLHAVAARRNVHRAEMVEEDERPAITPARGAPRSLVRACGRALMKPIGSAILPSCSACAATAAHDDSATFAVLPSIAVVGAGERATSGGAIMQSAAGGMAGSCRSIPRAAPYSAMTGDLDGAIDRRSISP